MHLTKAKKLAEDLMKKHGLEGWTFRFDRAKRRFGYCNYKQKTITLSKEITRLNDEERVKNTLLHEIAHALLGPGYGHKWEWQNKALEIGCDAERCFNPNVVKIPKGKYLYECPNCKKVTEYMRKLRRATACGPCCKKHNFGEFTEKFKLVFKGENK